MSVDTPSALPANGRAFLIVLPDSEEWFAKVFGALVDASQVAYWHQSAGGITPEQAAQVVTDLLWSLRYDKGTPT